jgi:hypothetical protein
MRLPALALLLLLPGCLHAWAMTFPRYYDVRFPADGGTPDKLLWLCLRERGEAILYCADAEQVLLEAELSRPTGCELRPQ